MRRFVQKISGLAAHAALILAAALALGFVVFSEAALKAKPPAGTISADGIVALTGDGVGRVAEGLKLLEEGRGARLLISGANRQATDHELAVAYKTPQTLFSCCVDVGRVAEDTIGNAAETAQWARAHDYKRLIVVTADFHMARSLAEIRMKMPEAILIPHPVHTLKSGKQWWRDGRLLRRLSVEYVKYLVTMTRAFAAWLNPFDNGRP